MEWQLRVASGQPLPLTDQADVTLSGHAVEARICAEKVDRGFLPAAGTLRHMRLPPGVDAAIGFGTADGSGIKTRVDTGVMEGDVVSTYYDPMVAKVGLHSGFSVSTCSFPSHLCLCRCSREQWCSGTSIDVTHVSFGLCILQSTRSSLFSRIKYFLHRDLSVLAWVLRGIIASAHRSRSDER